MGVCAYVCDNQEKRKIPAVPNGELAESEEHGGHGGPELQHTGRWVWIVCVCVYMCAYFLKSVCE